MAMQRSIALVFGVCSVALVVAFVAGSRAQDKAGGPDGKKAPGGDESTKVVREKVTGGIAFLPEKRQWIRITGKVKVLSAHTLVYEDGTKADLGEAPELEQKGLIGDSFYPCGKEAAEFLKKIIADRSVTCLAHPDHVEGKNIRPSSCFVGETNLNIELVRNGWAISDHSAMDGWEIIARENKRGLWRGRFIVTERWRKGDRLPGE